MTQPPPLPEPPVPAEPQKTPGSTVMWVIAFLFFPFGTIIYMAYLRVVSFWLSAVLFVFSVVLCFFVDINSPRGLFAVLVLLYAVGVIQFILGRRKRIWSPRAIRVWKSLAYAGAVLTFLLPWCLFELNALNSLLQNPDSLDW